jgi:hypothetical protein
VSDSFGRYLLNDVPIGRYKLGFLHPLLDSLGVEAPLRDVFVDSYRPVIADLAVPSPSRIRVAICGSQIAKDSGGVILGTVRGAADGSPAQGVTVTGEWLEYSLGRTGLTRQIARRTATTAETGWFALCNVPSGGSVALVASKGSDSTGLIEVEVPADGFVRREMYIGSAKAEVVAATPAPATEATSKSPATTTAMVPLTRRVLTGNGHVSGTVVSTADKRPLRGAVVGIVDGPQTRTNDRGEFTIVNAPTGTRMLEVRAVGFYPDHRHVNVVAGAPSVTVGLSTLKAVLDTVRIVASRLANGGADNGFEKRRRQFGSGHFISAEDIAKFPSVVTSDVFRRVPGVQTGYDSTGQKFLAIRGAFEDWCKPAIFINDHDMSFLSIDELDTWVYPQEVKGIEVYTGAGIPAQYQVGLKGCGSIVIWTR